MSYLNHLVHFFDLSTPVGNPDLGIPGGNPAVGANIASNPNGVGGGICAEFNGNNSVYNLGDIVELNSVSAFSICFWMNQNVLTVFNQILLNYKDAAHAVYIQTVAGRMYFHQDDGLNAYGSFIHSTVISAMSWHHVAMVFDGAQDGNANRLVVYVDADPVTLTFIGTIPAVTADLSGVDVTIGATASAFDGKLDTFMFFNTSLTHLQVTDLWNRTRQGQL